MLFPIRTQGNYFMLPKITQYFDSTKSDGTGLGLTLVKGIVQAHSSKLSIQSNFITEL